MTTSIRPPGARTRVRLAHAIATALKAPLELVDRDVPFAALGMDSLVAVELTVAIEEALGIEIPMSAVHEFGDLSSFESFLDGNSVGTSVNDPPVRMRQDAVLPPGIKPSFRGGRGRDVARTADARNVLVTGATGFVGAHLVRTLLDETPASVTCLVRSETRNPADRVRANLVRYGLWRDADINRVQAVRGDLSRFLLGLRPETFVRLAEDVETIYHGAAAVDWVQGYDALRESNVVGTREILRLACTGEPKPVHFLSSLGVCYSTRGPRLVDEHADMLPAIDGLHLGYAQSKCVAESLVRAAAARGLSCTITRPALVSGDSRSGRSNVDDLLARFMAGCVGLRVAPDLDWRVDCIPADHVAQAVVRLSRSHVDGLSVAHLSHPRARHWRECVLWMRLCGYDLDLVPYDEWLNALSRAPGDNPLYPLRSFFLRRVPTEAGLTLPELYEESRRSAVSTRVTDARLAVAGIACPPLSANLLDAYFVHYVAEGIMPPTPRHASRRARPSRATPVIDDALPSITRALAERYGDPTLSVSSIELAPFETDESIVAELTSWRGQSCTGLFLARLALTGRASPSSVEAVVKSKPVDDDVTDVGQSVAHLASRELGDAYDQFRTEVGFTKSHLRELALYENSDARLRRNMPRVYAVVREDDTKRWTVVMERVTETVALPPVETDTPWLVSDLEVVLRGLAEVHAMWYAREEELRAEPWLAPPRDSSRLLAMTPLWSALARHAELHSTAWRVEGLAVVHDELLSHISEWATRLCGRRTLIHNDFNPRNITLRAGAEPRLCAYDWELATIGLPQRDLAELLCFTLSPRALPGEIQHWVDRYRELLTAETCSPIDPSEWSNGFRVALGELLIDRLAMYAMVDRIRPQRFLPRVVQTWLTLWRAATGN